MRLPPADEPSFAGRCGIGQNIRGNGFDVIGGGRGLSGSADGTHANPGGTTLSHIPPLAGAARRPPRLAPGSREDSTHLEIEGRAQVGDRYPRIVI